MKPDIIRACKRPLTRGNGSSHSGPAVKAFFDQRTFSIQYVVSDPDTGMCAIIDPVLDFDEKSSSTATYSADVLLRYIESEDLSIEWILDTHPHADHLSAAHYLKTRTGAPIAIGDKISEVQAIWKKIYNWPDFPTDGSQWDHRFADGESFKVGNIACSVMHSPGHTLASVTYLVGNAAFVHDSLFMPDSGTARADFPGGSANHLWSSIQNILSLPRATRIFTGHDYQPGGRLPMWESTVGEQRISNIHLLEARTEQQFVELRNARDATLPMPKLLLQSLQINLRAGRLPEPENNGMRFLKIPLNALLGVPGEARRE